MTPAQQDAARRLFLRLVTPGEGQDDTRARSLIPDDPEQREIVTLFANPKTRLLVTGVGQMGSDTLATVEVARSASDSALADAPSVGQREPEKLRSRAAILRAQAEWEERGKTEDYLLPPGVQLERGRALVYDPGDVPIDDISDYVSRSIEKEQRRLDAEREMERRR